MSSSVSDARAQSSRIVDGTAVGPQSVLSHDDDG